MRHPFLAAAIALLISLVLAPHAWAATSGDVSSAPQGDWVGRYGQSGYVLAAWNGGSDLVSLPGATARLVSGQRTWWSESDSDVRSLQAPDRSFRRQATYYDAGRLQVRLDFSRSFVGFIETSQFGGPEYRAPTPDEFRGEMWDAIAHGARGIFYFTLGKGEVQDGVEPDVVTEMQRQNATLTRLAPMLASPATMRSAPAPFEVATRSYCGVQYTLVLNFSHNDAVYQGVAYGPYQLRISPDPPQSLSCASSG